MLYEPFPGKYIKFIYNIDDREYTFYSKYVAKLIDYGSSFTEESHAIYKELCEMDKTCGKYKGFLRSRNQRHITYDKPNLSSDLRLLFLLQNINTKNQKLSSLIGSLNPSLIAGDKDIREDRTKDDEKINNIKDAYFALRKIINPEKKESVCSITVYGNEPFEVNMDFVSDSEEESNTSNISPMSINSN
jgi:hypothetical protein